MQRGFPALASCCTGANLMWQQAGAAGAESSDTRAAGPRLAAPAGA